MKNELEIIWQKAVNASFGVLLFPNLPGVSGKNYGKFPNQNNHSTGQDLKTKLLVFEAALLPA
jgi:hypothetical protein